jgi:TolB-like protein
VLPFHALAVSQQARFLGVGIPDAIITRLAGLQQLTPRPTSAVLKYENESIDPKDAGKALASDYVLTGILQEANERLRVSVQLVRAQDGAPMWGDHYDVSRSDLLTLQDQISQSVADALKIQMTAAERERLFRRYTENAAAYERYLRGRAQFSRYSAESLREAVDTFEEALKLDQNYAPARAGVALASGLLGLRFAPASESRAWNERAEREAKAALQIDPQLAEAHEALAAVYRAVEFEWERALEESRLALALNPHLDQPRLYRAAAFYHLGLLDLVEPELQAAAATLNPDPANQVETLRTRGVTALLAGRYQDALLLFEDVQRLSGGTAFNYLRGLARYYTGDASGAEEILALRGSTRGDRRSQAVLASLLARRRAGAEAKALVKAIQDGGYMDHHIAYSLGATYAQLGELPEAMRWLSDAARTGLPCYPWYARDPLLDPLRDEPAFKQTLERLNSSWQALLARYKSEPT